MIKDRPNLVLVEQMEGYLRDIYDNPQDLNLMEDRLGKMKPYMNIDEEKNEIKVNLKGTWENEDKKEKLDKEWLADEVEEKANEIEKIVT